MTSIFILLGIFAGYTLLIYIMKRYRDRYPVEQAKPVEDFSERNLTTKPLRRNEE